MKLLQTVHRRFMVRPIGYDFSQSRHIYNRGHIAVRSEALHLFRNVTSLSCQPWVPVNCLSPIFLFEKDPIRQPPFHGPPDQPAFTPFAQILIFGDADAKLNNSPVKGGCPNINVKAGSQLCKPVSRLAVTMEVINSSESVITSWWRVEWQIFACRSINDPTLSGKFRTNYTIIMPGGFSSTPPLFVLTKKTGRDEWRNCPMANHFSP